jgi:NAD(P)-dependent dehydrogenase (short-subunit alcohol dehydrogenase family)
MTQVIFILGASGGIGSALARRLRERDVQLVLASRSEAPLRELASELGARAMPLDGSDFEEVDLAIDEVVKQHGRLDGIVNCAGSLVLKPAHRTSDAEWRATLSANLDTSFAVVRAGARAMLKTGGSIVLVSSAAARFGLPNHEAIAAAKAGVIGLAQSAAASYATRGIRVNVVAPGMTRTGMSAGLLSNAAVEQASTAMHPLGRLGEPEDIARAIDWLLDPAQSWVTAQTIGVDGGLASVQARKA